ncbi:hypothetical protein [Allorhizocola rhizosphaerae]|uniref:hypothetical protein n=1 Tax=Allorhizocola rhizosphaerae TaxID=1872709 RepID=UPI001B8AC6C8|nr:hypothetical protein [Allorhizocola rhizosphaerae]
MRLPSPRFLMGLVLVLAVSVGTVYAVKRLRGDGAPAAAQPVSVACLIGSEKAELMADPEVTRILRERYGVTVRADLMGSYDQVQLAAEELSKRDVDCLWPSSASAQSVYEHLHRDKLSGYRAETVLQSPEVLYAGPQGTDALIRAGIVEKRSDRYFVVNMKSLLLDHILSRKTWESLGTKGFGGPIRIASTDPARSGSGFTLTQLELNIVATHDVFQTPNLEQARAALPTIRAIYEAQGLQASSSDFGFRQWLTQGAELQNPLYAGYESQIIQLVTQAGAAPLKEVRVLYPDPTIYNDHPVLALNADAARFLDAMKDREIQTIAWRRYGFRSSVHLGLNDLAEFKDLALADRIRTTTPPNAEVTLALLDCVKHNKC